MIVNPEKGGISVYPESEFELEYLKNLFTNNQKHSRKVYFNFDTGELRVLVEKGDECERKAV